MYRHAENIRVTQSDGSNAGLIEDIKGTKLLAKLSNLFTIKPFTKAKTIGTGKDSFTGKIYYLVTTDGDDYLIEYNTTNSVFARVLQHSTALNLNENYPISEIKIIRDSISEKTYATWTDNFNEPRFINIGRAKTWPVNGFIEEDILLIKKPPRYAPIIELRSSPSMLENNIEEKYIAFSYRFKYLDGEYSALSDFSNYAFSPKQFNLDFATKENIGMVNSFNAVNVKFNTGSKRVTAVDLVFKESRSNNIYKIQTFDKADEEWGNDEIKEFLFTNDKVYTVLPERELYRSYDNVPLLAGDVDVIDNTLVFADYLEGYNLKDVSGKRVNIDYSLSLVGEEIINRRIPTSIFNIPITNIQYWIINFQGEVLTAGHKLMFHVVLQNKNYQGSYTGDFEFILPQNYSTLTELANDTLFKDFIENVWTQNFTNGYQIDLPDHSEILNITGFQLIGINGNSLMISRPLIRFRVDNTPNNPNDNDYTNFTAYFNYNKSSFVETSNYESSSSLKSNRSYEVGLIYQDKFNRRSTVLVDGQNTLFIPNERSIYKNQLQVDLKHNPPIWADRFKFVLKSNKAGYETIYISNYYFDGSFVWCLLDGANKNKVQEGDILIVKSDVGGVVEGLVKTKVLEIKQQPRGFINDNTDTENTITEGEEGLYMKIRPNEFSMGAKNVNQSVFYGYSRFVENHQLNTAPEFGDYNDTGEFNPYKLTEGSRVRIWVRFWRHGSDSFDITYDNTYTVGSNYDSFQEWFEVEADLSSLETNVVENGDYVVSPATWIPIWEYGTGYGFTEDGKNFWVRQRGEGSGNRKLYTEVKWEIYTAERNNIIFETEPKELEVDVYFETAQTFDIIDGKHQGNIQNQEDDQSAICLLDSYNCFVQGNGAESYKIKDDFNKPELDIDFRPSIVSEDEYRAIRRYASITWSGVYKDETQYNSLNEFNLATGNYKHLDPKFGNIRRVAGIEGNLYVFQDDKISYVLYGKKALYNQDGSVNLSATDVAFGDQVYYNGDYGCQHPLSIVQNKKRFYFIDRKRGTPCRLSLDGIEEIPGYYYEGENMRRELMGTFFKELLRSDPKIKCLGVYDPEYEEYILHAISTTNLLTLGTLKSETATLTDNANPLSNTQNGNILKNTLGFNESAGGWTSFYSYNPDMLVSLNGKLYGFENGDLHIFNFDAVNRNSFFGKQYNSKLIGVANDFPSEVKIWRAFNIEGNRPWRINFRTNLTNGKINLNEFKNYESEFYAHFRKNESIETHSQATQGIGELISYSNGWFTTSSVINSSVAVGDQLYLNDLETLLGTITEIDGNRIKVVSLSNSAGFNTNLSGFLFAQKNMRISGSDIRGYFMEYEMIAEPGERIELYSVNMEISKSYP